MLPQTGTEVGVMTGDPREGFIQTRRERAARAKVPWTIDDLGWGDKCGIPENPFPGIRCWRLGTGGVGGGSQRCRSQSDVRAMSSRFEIWTQWHDRGAQGSGGVAAERVGCEWSKATVVSPVDVESDQSPSSVGGIT